MTEGAISSRRIGPSSWMGHVILASMCMAEAAVVWLIANAIVSAPEAARGDVPIWLVAMLIWIAALLPIVLDALDVWERTYAAVTGLAIVVTTLLAIKVISAPGAAWASSDWLRESASGLIFRPNASVISPWVPVGLSAFAWWRGRTRAEPSIDSVFRLLRAGFGALLCGAVGMAVVSDETGESAAAVPIFVVAGLLAVGLIRLKHGEFSPGLGIAPRSVVVAILPVLLVALLGVGLAGLLSQELFETIVWALSPLIWALGVILRAIVLVIALIALLLMTPLFWLLDGRELNLGPVRITSFEPFEDNLIKEASNRASGTPDLIRYVIAAVVLIALFSGVTRFVLRRRKRVTPLVSDEERTTHRPVFDFGRWLARLRDALGRRQGEQIHDPLDALRGDPRWAATVSIRERYREMLVWAAERGTGRPAGTTPAEHGTMLKTGLAGTPAPAEIETMTDIYARARYGGMPAPDEDAIAIETAWRRLLGAGRAER